MDEFELRCGNMNRLMENQEVISDMSRITREVANWSFGTPE
jgi:hypothetical protein